jgi:hypothetical protein
MFIYMKFSIVNLVADILTFGIYSAYQNQCILDSRTKKCTEEINQRLGNI